MEKMLHIPFWNQVSKLEFEFEVMELVKNHVVK